VHCTFFYRVRSLRMSLLIVNGADMIRNFGVATRDNEIDLV
jgi:hypothetical protein